MEAKEHNHQQEHHAQINHGGANPSYGHIVVKNTLL